MRFFLACLAAVCAAWPADFVRVSPRDARFLELSSGAPYIPNGPNMIAPPANDMARMEEWLAALETNGGNYIRVWLGAGFWDVEHERSGVYDAEKAGRINRLLEVCRRRGIRVKMTLEYFRTIGEPTTKSWSDKPLHHVSRGGPARGIADFFDGEASREQFKRKIRWYAERYGSDPVIYGWELWNEVNAVRGGDYMAWTEVMLAELHKAFPRNLCLQSLGSFDRARARETYRRHSTMPGNDLAQVHRYLDLGAELEVCHGPVDVLAADAVRELLAFKPGRPVVLAESGAVEPRHTGPFKLYRADREGMLLHDVLFAPFFAGAAGAGQIWHWDHYVAANGLWHHYARFAEVVKGLDPPAERFEPVMVEHPRLRVYLLRGRRTLLAWCRDKRNTWESELKNGEKPEVLRGLRVAIDGAAGPARVYDPWANRWSEAKIAQGRVELPPFSRSIVVRAAARLAGVKN